MNDTEIDALRQKLASRVRSDEYAGKIARGNL